MFEKLSYIKMLQKIVKGDLDKPIPKKSCLSIIVDQNLNSKNDLYNFDKKTFC